MKNIADALSLWTELTGVDPSAKVFTIGQMEIRSLHQELNEALELDSSQITAYLLLDYYAQDYFAKRSFSIRELLEDEARTRDYLNKAQELIGLLRAPEITDIGERFRSAVGKAVEQYGAVRPDVIEMLDDRHALAVLRRDALRSMEQLSVHQFLQGEADKGSPQYLKTVHCFWNVNSLLQMACRSPSGVSLNLIRDPDGYNSYFAFCIRNGGTLTLLTDRPEYSHPLQSGMSRRPDRAFANRVWKNHFPYELTDYQANENEYLHFKKQSGLIAYQQQYHPLKLINELAPDEIIWVAMMFDLIVERFWKQNYHTPELSYTADMIQVETPLIDAAKTSNLPVAAYRPISAPALTVADLLTRNVDEKAAGRQSTWHNQWLEDRYAAQVPDTVLNLIAAPSATFYLTDKSDGIQVQETEEAKRINSGFLSRSGKRYELKALDPTAFSTQEELLADRLFLARHNLAKQVQKLADEEFARRKAGVKQWYEERVRANRDALLDYVGQGELMTPANGMREFDQISWRVDQDKAPDTKNILVIENLDEIKNNWMRMISLESVFLCERSEKGLLCAVTGVKPSYRAVFFPQDSHDLALMCGCAVADLPDVLQHWTRKEPYVGNQILDRIDPMEWALSNPWQDLCVDICIPLSKRGLAKLQKARDKTASAAQDEERQTRD